MKGTSFIGVGNYAQKVQDFIERAAKTDLSLLLLGETGAGKDHVAELIHNKGDLGGRFITVDCGVLSEGLSESELFGHARGSFTGAVNERQGVISLATNGTLFFNEIANMSLGLQAKFLRILEKKSFRQVGGKEEIEVKTRIITATNADLQSLIKAGQFREDLFHRLNLISFTVPPLRERKEDIEHFIEYFLDGKIKISPFAKQKLLDYDYPGNVRELKHILTRAIFNAGDNATIETENLGLDGNGFSIKKQTVVESKEIDFDLDKQVETLQRTTISEALKATKGNKSHAAILLKIARNRLMALIKRLSLE